VAPISVGYSILSKAIMEATGAQKASLREKAVAFGDLGDAAVAVKASQRTLSFGRAASKQLLIDGIDGQIGLFRSLHSISRERGSGAQERKRAVIARLLVAAKGMETKYVVRTLEGQLRVGSAKKTILKALASAFALTPPANGEAGKTVGGYIEGSSSARERKRLEAAMAAANTAAQDCFAQVRIFTNGRFVSNVPHVCPESVLANRAVFIEKARAQPPRMQLVPNCPRCRHDLVWKLNDRPLN
jgi:DNA ligase-1